MTVVVGKMFSPWVFSSFFFFLFFSLAVFVCSEARTFSLLFQDLFCHRFFVIHFDYLLESNELNDLKGFDIDISGAKFWLAWVTSRCVEVLPNDILVLSVMFPLREICLSFDNMNRYLLFWGYVQNSCNHATAFLKIY